MNKEELLRKIEKYEFNADLHYGEGITVKDGDVLIPKKVWQELKR